jgi:hypothetical protein
MEINLTPLDEELKKLFIARRENDVTPKMSTRSATVDMAVKWRLQIRKRTDFEDGIFCGTFSKNPFELLPQICVMELEHTKHFLRLSSHFTGM